jgi:hypothetical protein
MRILVQTTSYRASCRKLAETLPRRLFRLRLLFPFNQYFPQAIAFKKTPFGFLRGRGVRHVPFAEGGPIQELTFD